jgi:hypothetical protein
MELCVPEGYIFLCRRSEVTQMWEGNAISRSQQMVGSCTLYLQGVSGCHVWNEIYSL